MSVQENPAAPEVNFLRLAQVKARVGMSKTQIYRLIQKGEFPSPLKLGSQSSVWPDSKIREWQDAVMRG